MAAGEDSEGFVDWALLRLRVDVPPFDNGPVRLEARFLLLLLELFVLFALFHLCSGRMLLNL